jgi:hypothetical protein
MTQEQQIVQQIVDTTLFAEDSVDFFRGIRSFKNLIRKKYRLDGVEYTDYEDHSVPSDINYDWLGRD